MADTTYNSSVNVLGSIPDFSSMIDYIIEKVGHAQTEGSFRFRTEKSLNRFVKAIDDAILSFKGQQHKRLFADALCSAKVDMQGKLLVLFWQLIVTNALFRKITKEVFMKALYSGRASLKSEEILSYLKFLKEEEPGKLPFSDVTLKTIASKYLTLLRKLGLAEGAAVKEIRHPSISPELFIYFVRLALTIYPEDSALKNPLFYFSFYDEATLTQRLKRIEFIDYWTITQVGNDITIELK